MKYLFALFFLTAVSQFTLAQQTVSLSWSSSKQESVVVEDVNSMYIENAANFLDPKTGVYYASFNIKGFQNFSGNIKVTNEKYEVFDAKEFGGIGEITFANTFKFNSTTAKARDIYVHSISITPIICNNGNCKRLISFEVRKEIENTLSRKSLLGSKTINLERTNSVLATGDWKRVIVDKTGVFEITSSLLSRLGYNPSTIDPNNVRVFGFGGKSLPLANSENLYFDPPEVAVDVVGGGDGSFGSNDRVYFYGVSTKGWNADNDSFINPYSDVAYYYINVTSGIQSKKVGAIVEPDGTPTSIFTTFNYKTFFEEDKRNISKQGREWFGEGIDIETTKTYSFFVPEREAGELINYNIRITGEYNTKPVSKLIIDNDSSGAMEILMGSVSSFYNPTNSKGSFEKYLNTTKQDLEVVLEVDKLGDPSTVVYLDYLEILAECKLKGLDRQYAFENDKQGLTTGVGQFLFDEAENISSIWDVSDPYNPQKKKSEESSTLSLKVTLGNVQKFIAFEDSDAYQLKIPDNFSVANQNIKGTIFKNDRGEDEDVDYLILTHRSLLSAANRLADFRRSKGLSVRILTTDLIYNEFSNGQQDVTALRNAVRYIYSNPISSSNRIKYLCVLGSASYDYKDRISPNTNLVPSYQAKTGNSTTNSYPSDDYFVVMDEGEGNNLDSSGVLDAMDLAVGRIIARNTTEANNSIDKIIRSDSQKSRGAWKRNISFISDDPNPDFRKRFDGQLQVMSNFSADLLSENIKRARVNKLFADAYPQAATSAGGKYPELEKAIISSFENGNIITFYLGHGNTTFIADESLLTAKTAFELTNENRPNVFVTVTCELTRLDDPIELTTGEMLYLNSRGGSTGLITTVRNITFSTALSFYPVFVDNLFDADKNARPIGEVLRLTKLSLSQKNKRTVFCVGDPAFVPSLPKVGVDLLDVNGDTEFDTVKKNADGSIREGDNQILKGLGNVELNGVILKSGTTTIDDGFEGVATISVFGKTRVQQTLANDGDTLEWPFDEVTRSFGSSVDTGSPHKIEFETPGKLLFSGKSSIREGKFVTRFIMPKNVDQEIGEGVISVYAENTKTNEERLDVATVVVGGLSEVITEDVTPPQVEIFLNDENFQDGQLVGAEPLIIARFSDESGINSAGGIGHDIIAILDGDESNPVVLNEFYNAEIDDFKTGRVEYRLLGLSDGEHTLEVRVSDSHNNVASKQITFNSANSSDFNIERVLNYPNPFTSKTGFWFSHTGISSLELEVFVQVFTVTGKIVKSLKTIAPVSGNNTYENVLMWDGKDDFGKKLGKGTYLYKISVNSPLLDKIVTKIEKLVIL